MNDPLRIVLGLAMLAVLYVGGSAQKASAQAVATPESILEQLKGRRTRGIATTEPDPDAERNKVILEALRRKSTRGLSWSTDDRKQITKLSVGRPSIDLEIFFDYNSDEISPKSLKSVEALAQALLLPALAGGMFIVGGHTDGKGSADYNQQLSERRARSVRQMLITRYGVPEHRLMAIGYGKDKLKTPDDPLAAVNRRVQVVNIGS